MVQVYCDSCKKEIRQPSQGVNYVSIVGLDVCIPCRDDLVRRAAKAMNKKGSYQLKAYHGIYEQTLHKMCK